MIRRLHRRRRQGGFTLIELLIVVAIIGIIAVILVPNFLDALQKANQRKTTADMRQLMTAMLSYITDQVGAAAAGQDRTFTLQAVSDAPASVSEIRNLLSPADPGATSYIQLVPENDGWGNAYEFYYSGRPMSRYVFAIRSLGQDGVPGCPGESYAGGCEAGPEYTVGSFPPDQYAQDIVGLDGSFIRSPGGAQERAGGTGTGQ
ncbi:MAG: prepilin-type N-terminal cleavage/methylation domain-containing protein [Thermoanaerobaculia bacterium]